MNTFTRQYNVTTAVHVPFIIISPSSRIREESFALLSFKPKYDSDMAWHSFGLLISGLKKSFKLTYNCKRCLMYFVEVVMAVHKFRGWWWRWLSEMRWVWWSCLFALMIYLHISFILSFSSISSSLSSTSIVVIIVIGKCSIQNTVIFHIIEIPKKYAVCDRNRKRRIKSKLWLKILL